MGSRDTHHDAPLEERVALEQELWDRERDRMHADPSLLQLTYPSYESYFTAYPEYRYVYDFLGPSMEGKRVLEVGCGSGVISVALALSGAHVTAVDVSASSLRVTNERAAHYDVADRVTTLQTPAERLEFDEGSFDVFLAEGVVHHLIIDEVMPRVYRFLVPGGRGVILEPQGNPVLDFAREHLPYADKAAEGEHGTDEFFTPATVRQILGHFDYGEARAFRLFGMLQMMIGMRGTDYAARQRQEARIQRFRRFVDPIDEALFGIIPPLRRLAQVIVLRFGRDAVRS